MAENRIFVAIDLKSFFASVECRERGLDPLTTNLVVADKSRTDKTICLAVTPSLKAYGIPGRPRLFEVVQKVNYVNAQRIKNAPGHSFEGSSCNSLELAANPALKLDYITATPGMARYTSYSTRIYDIYLKYIAPEDMHVYSIDEVFMDVTAYLKTYNMTPREFTRAVIQDVLDTTGITATAGIGTNMYLCKIAMDIVAKHTEPDKDGVRIAELDEMTYRQQLWAHKPITDFWRVGRGYARRLAECGMYTMGDIAKCSVGSPQSYYNEGLLYKIFGINAELLIDHAWGWEPCTIKEIKSYKSANNSLGSGQVLQSPYTCEKARLVVLEMTDLLSLDLVSKGLVTDQVLLTVGYDIENLTDAKRRANYKGSVTVDHYGRKVPKQAHSSGNIGRQTSSSTLITNAMMEVFDRIVDKNLLVRRITVAANHVVDEASVVESQGPEQLDLFTDYDELRRQQESEQEALEREKEMQKAMINIKNKYGKNAILRGMNLEEGATARERNNQIGGHKA